PSTGIRSKADRWSLSAANAARLIFPTSSISPNAYRSSIGENRARASDSVIHPRSPTGRSLSDADNASSSTALSLRASGGVDMPLPNAALMVFHIPMRERYIASLQGATAASLGLPELRPLPHRVTILPRQRPGSPQFSSLRPVGVGSTGFAWATAASHAERPVEASTPEGLCRTRQAM